MAGEFIILPAAAGLKPKPREEAATKGAPVDRVSRQQDCGRGRLGENAGMPLPRTLGWGMTTLSPGPPRQDGRRLEPAALSGARRGGTGETTDRRQTRRGSRDPLEMGNIGPGRRRVGLQPVPQGPSAPDGPFPWNAGASRHPTGTSSQGAPATMGTGLGRAPAKGASKAYLSTGSGPCGQRRRWCYCACDLPAYIVQPHAQPFLCFSLVLLWRGRLIAPDASCLVLSCPGLRFPPPV